MIRAIRAVVLGDLFMRCLYRVRPYEKVKGSANQLWETLQKDCIDELKGPHFTKGQYSRLCRKIVSSFDTFPIDESLRKPRVGIVGEILVKYLPLANNLWWIS